MTNKPSPITNFAEIDADVWRGARPDSASDVLWLIKRGVKTVVNLEWEQSDTGMWANTEIALVRLADFEPLPAIRPFFEDQHIYYLLGVIRTYPKPIFIHCRSGQNRTGIAVAAYRLIMKDEDVDSVITDMKSFGGIWSNVDESYVRSLALRREGFRKEGN